jgi:hypothetical protein
MNGTNKDRFDLADDFKAILTAAVRLNIVDPTEIYLYGVNGSSETDVLEDLVTTAFANYHSDKGNAAHGEIVRMIDAYRATRWARAQR